MRERRRKIEALNYQKREKITNLSSKSKAGMASELVICRMFTALHETEKGRAMLTRDQRHLDLDTVITRIKQETNKDYHKWKS